MSTTPTVPESAALATPAIARIRTLADELEAMGTTVLMKAVEVGNLLSEAKAALPHGQWIPWLEKNVNFNARTAQRWMKVAEEHAAGRLKYDSVSYLSEAYQLSVAPRPSTAEERTTEPKTEAPAPAPARRSPAPVIDAEIVDPSTIPQDGPEPAALVIDGIKEAHQPEALTHNDAKLLKFLDGQIEKSVSSMVNIGVALPFILALLPRLSKDELSKVMGAAVTRWETITGISTGGTSAR
jgi:hypothetical protein